MPSAVASAIAAGIAAAKTVAGLSVVYKRGGDSVALTAIPGNVVYEVTSETGSIETFRSRDWLINISDLDFGAGALLPARGDTIEETVGAIVYEYTVNSLPDGQHYRTGANRVQLRIHTKQTATT